MSDITYLKSQADIRAAIKEEAAQAAPKCPKCGNIMFSCMTFGGHWNCECGYVEQIMKEIDNEPAYPAGPCDCGCCEDAPERPTAQELYDRGTGNLISRTLRGVDCYDIQRVLRRYVESAFLKIATPAQVQHCMDLVETELITKGWIKERES
jgi:hypothetical protein